MLLSTCGDDLAPAGSRLAPRAMVFNSDSAPLFGPPSRVFGPCAREPMVPVRRRIATRSSGPANRAAAGRQVAAPAACPTCGAIDTAGQEGKVGPFAPVPTATAGKQLAGGDGAPVEVKGPQ